MQRFIGTKIVDATPMTRGEYNAYRGWTPPQGEDQSTAGFLVEYLDGGQANDSRHAGYISWSPADVFERSYKALEQHAQDMDPAIDFLRQHAEWCNTQLEKTTDPERAEALREVGKSCRAAIKVLVP